MKNKVWENKEYFRWIWNEWIKNKNKCIDKNTSRERKTSNKNKKIKEKLKPKLRDMKTIETEFVSYILVELIKIYIIDILENLK